MHNRFVIERLSFTGPSTKKAELRLGDGLNVVWGASNTGKSFTVKALNFMLGADKMPSISKREGYDSVWLKLDLPKAGKTLLRRATNGGDFDVYFGDYNVGFNGSPSRVLASEHRGDSLSAFLLAELGIQDRKIAKNTYGDKVAFTFRLLAPYLLTDETDMIGEWSPIRLSDYSNPTLDKNVFKFILTGTDDTAMAIVQSAEKQKTANLGKIELLDEMIANIEKKLSRLEKQPEELREAEETTSVKLEELTSTIAERQEQLDRLRSERRTKGNGLAEAEDRIHQLTLTIDRFNRLDEVYRSDLDRLKSLEEGGAALLAGSRRSCPLCGAEPKDQVKAHGLDDVRKIAAAAGAEAAKIWSERVELRGTRASLTQEHQVLEHTVDTFVDDIAQIEEQLEEIAPQEISLREDFERYQSERERLRENLTLADRLEELRSRRNELERFKATRRSRKDVSTGVSTLIGHELAMAVKEVLDKWRFPGQPTVSFSEKSHDILIDGKDRSSNGKGVRALLNAALKVAILAYCRSKQLPHPGFVVLDSPLLSYREPLQSKHGDLSADEQEVKRSGLKDYFYQDLISRSSQAQFLIIENDPPGGDVPAERVTVFSGPGGGDREGFF